MSFVPPPTVPPPGPTPNANAISPPHPQTLHTSSDITLHHTLPSRNPTAQPTSKTTSKLPPRKQRKGRGKPWDLSKQRKYRQGYDLWRNLRREPWNLPITSQNLAAIEVQKVARGFVRRRRKARGINVIGMPSPVVPMNPDQISLLTTFLTKIEGGKENPNAAALFSIYCATKIASWFRMIKWRYRFNYKKFPFYTIAALLIQNSWRHSYQQHYLNESSYMSSAIQYQTPEDKYAAKIQNAWRKNSSVKIYKFYRDLINFRLSGDPKMLLKTINPSEASLFDAATKIHIRLRLGGSSFPPCLYYKIFTSAPCSDIGAFAPRNYAESKHLDTDELHNKSTVSQGNFPGRFDGSVVVGKSEFAATGILDGDGTDGWYQRVENNGWRAVTVRAQEELREDSVEIDTAAQTKNKFHFSRLVRKKDIAIMRKKKKRLWLRRMYEIGLAKEVEDGRIDIVDKQAMVTQELMAGGDVGDLKMFTKHMDVGGGGDFLDVGEDGEVDVEVEKLLNWTSDLDYDGYVDEWSKIGTSTGTGIVRPKENTANRSTRLTNTEDDGNQDGFFDYGLGFS